MGKWHYISLNAVQERYRTNRENIIYVNHLWNQVKINDKQNWVPFVVDFHLAAPNNKIVIKESYQLDFNSKHFQKTVPKSQLISLQQPPNCSKLVVKGKKKKNCFKWKRCIPSAGACSILSLIIPRISPVHELPLKIIYRRIDMSVLSVCVHAHTHMDVCWGKETGNIIVSKSEEFIQCSTVFFMKCTIGQRPQRSELGDAFHLVLSSGVPSWKDL